jgi:hypothetical protein
MKLSTSKKYNNYQKSTKHGTNTGSTNKEEHSPFHAHYTNQQIRMWKTGEDDQREVNGSQSKFLTVTWSISQIKSDDPLF